MSNNVIINHYTNTQKLLQQWQSIQKIIIFLNKILNYEIHNKIYIKPKKQIFNIKHI